MTYSGVFTLAQQMQSISASKWPSGSVPPVSGYIGLYTGSSFVAGSQWTDLSGNGNHATIGGSPTAVTTSIGNGSTKSFVAVQGSTSASITFPAAILPSTYTLFHVAGHSGANEQRIFNGLNNNWLSGFWNGYSGVAYHEGWLTPQTDIHSTNWVYSTDQNSLYRSNGVTRGTSGGSASARLTINISNVFTEASDWQVAEVIVYNGTMNSTDYQLVENYLKTKYGL